MASLNADNLRNIVAKAKFVIREDWLEAIEAAAIEIDRLQIVVGDCHKKIREMKKKSADTAA